jgi:hypothetical protein
VSPGAGAPEITARSGHAFDFMAGGEPAGGLIALVTPDGSARQVAEDGSLSNRRVWAEGIGPDGICLDADGAIWAQSFLSATQQRTDGWHSGMG